MEEEKIVPIKLIVKGVTPVILHDITVVKAAKCSEGFWGANIFVGGLNLWQEKSVILTWLLTDSCTESVWRVCFMHLVILDKRDKWVTELLIQCAVILDRFQHLFSVILLLELLLFSSAWDLKADDKCKLMK